MNKTILSILAAMIFFISCAEENRSNNRRYVVRDAQSSNPLAVRTTAEILTIKYTRAILTCSLWSQKAKFIDMELAPNDVISLDLKANPVLPQNFKLSANVENHQVELTLAVFGVDHYSRLNHTDAEGNVYFALFSPYVQINTSYTSTTTWQNGNTSSDSRMAYKIANERIKEIILTQTMTSPPVDEDNVNEEEESYSDLVECTLATSLRAPYEDQFRVTPVNP